MTTNPTDDQLQGETLEKEFDEPHRWEVEPHPYSSDYDCFVTDDDKEALKAIMETAEMYLWDENDGEERTLRVKMNNSIPNNEHEKKQ